jgi:hypothetical protein
MFEGIDLAMLDLVIGGHGSVSGNSSWVGGSHGGALLLRLCFIANKM